MKVSPDPEPKRRRFRLLPGDPTVGWTPYGWLVWAIPFGIMAFQPERPLLQQGLAALTLVLFLGLYFGSYWVRGRKQALLSLCIFAIGAIWVPFNYMAVSFYIFSAAFVGSWTRPPRGWAVLTAMATWVLAEGLLIGYPLMYTVSGVVFVGLIGGINVHFEEVGRRNARLRLAQNELEQLAKAAERERIGRDLHDLLGQSLSVISLKSQVAQRLAESDPARAREEMDQIETIARDALSEVRRAVRGYRHVQLGTELVKARVMLEAANVELDVTSCPFDLSPESESALALAVREAATNVMRHARATRCRIDVSVDRADLVLEIEDDGVGLRGREGAGLAGMRERLAEAGGQLEIEPGRLGGRGTLLRARMPMLSERDAPPSSVRATS